MPARRPIDPNRIEILDDDVVRMLKQKTFTERVAMVGEADRTMRELLDAKLRWQHPDWDDEQITKEIARRRSLESN